MARDDVLRSAARLIRLDPSIFGDFLDLLVPEELDAKEIQRFVKWDYDVGKKGPTLKETIEAFEKRIDDRIEKIRKDCPHDWENLGGHEYIEQVCRTCGKSEWF